MPQATLEKSTLALSRKKQDSSGSRSDIGGAGETVRCRDHSRGGQLDRDWEDAIVIYASLLVDEGSPVQPHGGSGRSDLTFLL